MIHILLCVLLALGVSGAYLVGAGWSYRFFDDWSDDFPPIFLLWPVPLVVWLSYRALRGPVIFLWNNPFRALWSLTERVGDCIENRLAGAEPPIPEARVVSTKGEQR